MREALVFLTLFLLLPVLSPRQGSSCGGLPLCSQLLGLKPVLSALGNIISPLCEPQPLEHYWLLAFPTVRVTYLTFFSFWLSQHPGE